MNALFEDTTIPAVKGIYIGDGETNGFTNRSMFPFEGTLAATKALANYIEMMECAGILGSMAVGIRNYRYASHYGTLTGHSYLIPQLPRTAWVITVPGAFLNQDEYPSTLLRCFFSDKYFSDNSELSNVLQNLLQYHDSEPKAFVEDFIDSHRKNYVREDILWDIFQQTFSQNIYSFDILKRKLMEFFDDASMEKYDFILESLKQINEAYAARFLNDTFYVTRTKALQTEKKTEGISHFANLLVQFKVPYKVNNRTLQPEIVDLNNIDKSFFITEKIFNVTPPSIGIKESTTLQEITSCTKALYQTYESMGLLFDGKTKRQQTQTTVLTRR